MSKQRTEKSIFESSYGGGNITPSQYITEILCGKIAYKKGQELPNHFWKLPEWNKIFRQQIPAANKLLKKYSFFVILKALRDKRVWGLTSLRAPFFIPILDECLKEETNRLKLLNDTYPLELKEDFIEEEQIIAKPIGNKTSIISKLKGL